MRGLTIGLLIFMAGWGLGWYSYQQWGADSRPSVARTAPAAPRPASPGEAVAVPVPAAPVPVDGMARLLRRNAFGAVLERYETLQDQADDAALAEARTRILAHARQLIAERRFALAEQLLQGFLLAAYRDVEAQVLMAEALEGQGDVLAAIEQLYEARGHAWRPDTLQRITGRIRAMVAELTRSLQRNGDQNALLALYQRLTQLEPDHAPWFMELAVTQLALADEEAARRSLRLVSQDPEVGARARAMLSELNVALARMQGTESWDAPTEAVGIPLHPRGNHFMVDARTAYGRNMRLLIDTGASLTIITPQVLEQRGIRYQDTGRTGVFNTANGPVHAPIYQLDALAVGDWQVNQIEIGVLDLGGRSAVDGLLGMNFLNHFQFFIDQNDAQLRLSAN